jgi:hypothetical protein
MLVMKPGFLFYIVKCNISISNIYFYFSSKRTIEALLACRLTMGYNYHLYLLLYAHPSSTPPLQIQKLPPHNRTIASSLPPLEQLGCAVGKRASIAEC